MKLVRGRAFGLRNTTMICGCPLDRLRVHFRKPTHIIAWPTSCTALRPKFRCTMYCLRETLLNICLMIPPYYPWLSCLKLKLRVDQAGSGGKRSFISLVVPP